MVEFAIILPLLVMLVYGITELGRALYQWNTLTKAVVTGARYMARANGDLINGSTDEGDPCAKATTWENFEPKAKNLVMYGQLTEGTEKLLPELEVTTLEPDVRSYDYGTACVIIIEATATFETIFGNDRIPSFPYGALGKGEPITLTARTEERYIGE